MHSKETRVEGDRCFILAQKILALVSPELRLGPGALQYIDSTFSNPTIEELSAILADESNCERETLLELIFFPDEQMQIKLEETIENFAYVKEDEIKLADDILSSGKNISLVFAETGQTLEIKMPEDAVSQFVSRLKVSKLMDRRIIQAIEQFVPTSHQQLFKVHFRNSPVQLAGNQAELICKFLEKKGADTQTALDCFDFLLIFFQERIDDLDLYQALMQKKNFYLHHLHKARKADEQIEKNNMETLFMQGIRTPYFDKLDAGKKIGLIDMISHTIFGKSMHDHAASISVDLGEYHDRDGLGRVFKILT